MNIRALQIWLTFPRSSTRSAFWKVNWRLAIDKSKVILRWRGSLCCQYHRHQNLSSSFLLSNLRSPAWCQKSDLRIGSSGNCVGRCYILHYHLSMHSSFGRLGEAFGRSLRQSSRVSVRHGNSQYVSGHSFACLTSLRSMGSPPW